MATQDYYRAQSSKNLVGPGAYNIPRELGSQRFYIGQKLKPIENHSRQQGQLNITGEMLGRLSTFVNDNSAVRLKTEYYPKGRLHLYDNQVPGPGSCTSRLITDDKSDTSSTSRQKAALTTFGASQRLKSDKPALLGPGR